MVIVQSPSRLMLDDKSHSKFTTTRSMYILNSGGSFILSQHQHNIKWS